MRYKIAYRYSRKRGNFLISRKRGMLSVNVELAMENKGYLVVAARSRAAGTFTSGDRPKSKKPIAVRLYADLEEKLRGEAEQKGVSIGDLILERLDCA